MKEKIGLVLEGGGFRGLFTEGVLDNFIEAGIEIPYVIGVSMGTLVGSTYISKQRSRNYNIAMSYANDDRYISMKNFLTQGSFFGIDFVFNDIAYDLMPFDFEAFHSSDQELVIGAMSCHSGLTDYFYKSKLSEEAIMTAMRASVSLPFISKKVTIKGVDYLDGGISDSIPVKKAFMDGCDKVIVILTRHESYVRAAFKNNRIGGVVYHDNPAVIEMMQTRHIRYRETLDYIKGLEATGKALVIRPPEPIKVGRAEKDLQKLHETFRLGQEQGKGCMHLVDTFINHSLS